MALILPILDCEVGEHVNKLIKKDFMPLAPMLRNGRLKNSFYYIMRNWQVRQLHFPGTIHVRRLEKCSMCGGGT